MTETFSLTVRTSKRSKSLVAVPFEIGETAEEPFVWVAWKLVVPDTVPKNLRHKLEGLSIGVSTFSGEWSIANVGGGFRTMTVEQIARVPERLKRALVESYASERDRIGWPDFEMRHPTAAARLRRAETLRRVYGDDYASAACAG